MAEVTAQDAVAAAGKDAAADACPKCYRTKTLHTNLRFMVSSCGHKMYGQALRHAGIYFLLRIFICVL
jgi:hypothetical protein